MAERCRFDRRRCVLVAGVAMVASRGWMICLRERERRFLFRRMVIVRLVHPIWLCVQQVERGAQSIGFCGCQEWLGLLMDLLDELIFRFVLVLHSWSHLILKRLYDLQTSCGITYKQYCNMCIDVPESTTVKCEPGDCCTFVCSTIKQVCVCVRACFSKESRYWYLSSLIKDLIPLISISPCTAAQE